MALSVRYNAGPCCAWGRILNIGSGGALFTIERPVSEGQRVELFIAWPVLLHEKVHLNLVAEGEVVRIEEGRAAVKFEQHSFRTSSATFRQQALLPEIRAHA
jgi:hypothetical protein